MIYGNNRSIPASMGLASILALPQSVSCQKYPQLRQPCSTGIQFSRYTWQV